MDIRTPETQQKLADLLVRFGNGDFRPPEGMDGGVWAAGWMLAHLMPVISKEVFSKVRQDERAKIADLIIGELVCCDIFETLEAAYKALEPIEVVSLSPYNLARKLDLGYHDMCYFGGWAAALAREGIKSETQ